jgi:Integrase core domain
VRLTLVARPSVRSGRTPADLLERALIVPICDGLSDRNTTVQTGRAERPVVDRLVRRALPAARTGSLDSRGVDGPDRRALRERRRLQPDVRLHLKGGPRRRGNRNRAKRRRRIRQRARRKFPRFLQTELIADRVWTSRVQLELATVEWVAWFNHDRLHSALGDIPPVEFEQRRAATIALIAAASRDGSLAAIPPKPADGLTTKRASTIAVDFVVDRLTGSPNAPDARALTAQAAPHASRKMEGSAVPSPTYRLRSSTDTIFQ